MLDLNTVLYHACGNPEDFGLWEREGGQLDPNAYTGYYIYEVESHCLGFRIIARPNGDGTYSIREYDTYNC